MAYRPFNDLLELSKCTGKDKTANRVPWIAEKEVKEKKKSDMPEMAIWSVYSG